MTLNKKIKFSSEIRLDFADDIVLCYGHFNLIHPGHLRYLQYAKTLAKNLIVVIRSDKELDAESFGRHFSENERAESVANLEIVDHVIVLNNKSLDELIASLRPSVLVLGREFKSEKTKKIELIVNAVKKQGRIVFHAGETHYASSHLLHDSASNIEINNVIKFRSICEGHKITCDVLQDRISNFSNLKLLVVGDTIVDNYTACDAIGMSAEAPVLVVKELENREFVGGAAVVASHV